MVKDEDGVVTVSLYEDLPAATEAPAAVEAKPEVVPTEATAAADAPTKEAKPEVVPTEATAAADAPTKEAKTKKAK